jgi:hypothetical protein
MGEQGIRRKPETMRLNFLAGPGLLAPGGRPPLRREPGGGTL